MRSPKIISSARRHEAYIQRLLELQRKAHRTSEETETAELRIVLIADYEAKHFTIVKVSGIEVLKELMDVNGLRQKDLADDLRSPRVHPHKEAVKKPIYRDFARSWRGQKCIPWRRYALTPPLMKKF